MLGFSGLLIGLLLSGVIFVFTNDFLGVTDYPLSLSWSEGNRMWDYSIAVLVAFFSEYFAAGVTDQSLLWGRLWPTPTNPLGILPALLLAVGSLVGLLLYWLWKRYWRLDWLHIAAILAPLLAFLGIGLVTSVNMGGGNNLHNLDMFLLGLVFVAALAWWAGLDQWIIQHRLKGFEMELLQGSIRLLCIVNVKVECM